MHIGCTGALHLCVNMSNAKFEVFVSSRNSQYYFRLKSGNSEIVLSSEGYLTKQGCLNGIASIKANSPYDSLYQRKNSTQNFTSKLIAVNGEIIGRSESYITLASRENGIAAVKHDASSAPIINLV